MQREWPIGIFDSGIGGLTVAAAIQSLLPNERILYFGDTARCPYGDRTPGEVLNFSREICRFLLSRGVKLLVVACNTATAAALPVLAQEFSVPILGVIQPGARAAARVSARERIGVIGTAVTIASGAYEREVKALVPRAEVFSLACPKFVPLVEQGYTSAKFVHRVVDETLSPLQKLGLDSLILGCTHYPHLQDVIQAVMGPDVRLISSADETAYEVKKCLQDMQLLNESPGVPAHVYFTTGDGLHMKTALSRWLGPYLQNSTVRSVSLDIEGLLRSQI